MVEGGNVISISLCFCKFCVNCEGGLVSFVEVGKGSEVHCF